MRWTNIALVILAAALVAVSIANIYPFVAPLIAHHQTQGIVTVILTNLLLPHPQTGIGRYYTWIILSIGVLMCMILWTDSKTRRRTTHGSARYAGRRERSKYTARRGLPTWQRPGRGIQTSAGGRAGRREFHFRLGWHRGREISLSEKQQNEHVLLTAPTGAGKSARLFVPNLLRETGTRSLFIGDLKNELYQVTAGWLAQHMQIWLFAPLRKESQGYNPLAHIHSVEDAQDFAEAWVSNTGGGGKDGEFWVNNAKLLITAMTLHLLATRKAPAFSELADVLTTSSFKEIQTILNGTRSPDARRLARQFLENMSQNERLVGSIMTDMGNRFQLLASAQARAVTATNEINFEEMIETPTAFFLTIPRSETRRYRPLLAVLTMQMFTAWERKGTKGIACYLDEFTNLGHIPGYADFISTARYLKVALLMAIQNFSQLIARYGREDADTIKANAIHHLLLPGAGLEETKYYSERIGDTTIATETINKRGYGWSEEITSSEGETRRRLMTADELRTMPEDQMLLLEAKSAPLLVKTKLYFEEKELAGRANIPYHVTHVRPEPPTSPSPRSPQSLPPASPSGQKTAPSTTTIVDADQDDDDLFFQQ